MIKLASPLVEVQILLFFANTGYTCPQGNGDTGKMFIAA